VRNFSALVNGLSQGQHIRGPNTLVLSSGDNIIPGPRFYAAEQNAVRSVTGSNEPGHADIAFLNAMGVKASALGNHELDAGPGELADAISSEERNGVVFPGATFPFLAANIDFSTEGDFADLVGTDGDSVENLAGKVASSAVVSIGGETIGLVGASTPLLDSITSLGGLTVKGSDKTIAELASLIQPSIDALEAKGINKVILLTHLQQFSSERELIGYLQGVDIVIAGGSNTRLGDNTDALFPGDSAFEGPYPFLTKDKLNNPVALVNVDGDYKYLGRLVVGFDNAGILSIDSLDTSVSGVYASTPAMVEAVGGSINPEVAKVHQAITEVIKAQYGNVLGYTSVYLDGRRGSVRTQETNLGTLTAQANLWYANLLYPEGVDLSLKNGGGIRTQIGYAAVPPGSNDYSAAVLLPPPANAETGTAEGAITEGHLRATLRFDNGLAVLQVTGRELASLLEHGLAESGPGATPGRFPQSAGMSYTYDLSRMPGSRLTSLIVTGADESGSEALIMNGEFVGDEAKTYRLVTLNFLAGGGDGYPFAELSNPDRVNLYEGTGFGEEVDFPDGDLSADPGKNSSFSYTGGEQDALAEYLFAFHADAASAYSD
jgi:2',3'-cyclic-nucleotide 2'-phosphodiesterase (5'-nucleotidase family)